MTRQLAEDRIFIKKACTCGDVFVGSEKQKLCERCRDKIRLRHWNAYNRRRRAKKKLKHLPDILELCPHCGQKREECLCFQEEGGEK